MTDIIKYFKVSDGTEIEYADLGGSGPVLLFIPGYSLSCELVVPVLAYLKDHFRCVTLFGTVGHLDITAELPLPAAPRPRVI